MLPPINKNISSSSASAITQRLDPSNANPAATPTDVTSKVGFSGGAASTAAQEFHNADGTTSIQATEEVNGQTIQVAAQADTEQQAIQAVNQGLTSASQAIAGQSGNSVLPTGNEPPGVHGLSAAVTNSATGESSVQGLTFSAGQGTSASGSTVAAGSVTSNESVDMTRQGDGTYSATGTAQAGNLADGTSVTGTSSAAVLNAAVNTLNTNLGAQAPTAGADSQPGVSSITAVTGSKAGTTATAQGAFRTYDSSGQATGAQQTGNVGTVNGGSNPLGLALQGATQSTSLAASVDAAARADVQDPSVQDAAKQLGSAGGKGIGVTPTSVQANYTQDLNNYITSKGKDPNNLSASDKVTLSTQFSQAVGYAMQANQRQQQS